MELLGTWGQMARNSMSGRGPKLASEAVDLTVTSVAAAAVGYATAKSNLAGKSGKLGGVPIPLAAGAVLAGLAVAGVGGEANHHIASAAKGCFAAQAAMFGVKAAYAGTGKPATIEGTRVAALPPGSGFPLNPGLYGMPHAMPHMGGTPATEGLLGRAGLVQG